MGDGYPPKITPGDPPHVLAPPGLIIRLLGNSPSYERGQEFLEVDDLVAELVATSTFQLFFMSKILAVKPIVSKEQRPFVLVTTVEREVWIPRKQWDAHKLSPVLDAYVGGTMYTDYYQKGDLLLDGVTVCDESDRILRDFSASMNPTIIAQVAGQVVLTQAAEATEMAALFAKKRAAETPEQKAARLEAAAAARAARKPADPIAA